MADTTLPYAVKTFETKVFDHHIYLFDFPSHGSEIVDLLYLINTAVGGQDVLHFHMNNTGGELTTGLQLLFAIEEAVVQGVSVVLYIESNCESMAAVFVMRLILLGAEIHYGEGFYLMFHNVNMAGDDDTATNILYAAGATQAIYKNLLERSCIPMLTQDEINDIISGKALYVFAGDLQKRMDNIKPHQETLH